MDTVAVLMSTYNGEKYLREQIDSILSQCNVDVTLFIRDDGSSDSTIEIITGYQKNNSNIKLDRGNNVGVGNSFMQLVYDVGDGFDYYAFADQDDVWLQDKLISAIKKIKQFNSPCLYASNQMLVDQNLTKIGLRYSKDPDTSYKQIMCQNKITGCTMVWNDALHIFISSKRYRPNRDLLKCRIHDVWVAMVAAVVGIIVYDPNSYLLYRQHENNVVGVRKTKMIKNWISKIKNSNTRNGRSALCKEIYLKYKDDALIDMTDIELYAFYNKDAKKKKALLRDKSLLNHTSETSFGYKIKILLNLF